jgi:methylene-tetrahydromethanopterin dehydrogenase
MAFMEKKTILHMLTPSPNVSPFDVNMAYDAGYEVVMPYTHITMDMVTGYTQDAIFSRGPTGVRRTGIFLGGRDIGLAYDMMDMVKRAMVPPFEVSVFADPSGAFTTAAAMVASVEHHLKKNFNLSLEGRRVVLLGGTGPVGSAAAVLASTAGAQVKVASHVGLARARIAAETINAHYGSTVEPADMRTKDSVLELLQDAEIVLGAAKAGVEVASLAMMQGCKALKVAADLNAVPPAGIAGIGLTDQGAPLSSVQCGAVGVGPLAIGNIKYKVMHGMFFKMLNSPTPVYLDFRDAFLFARDIVVDL